MAIWIETRLAEASFRRATTGTALTTGVTRVRSSLLAKASLLEDTRAVMTSEGLTGG